MWIDSNDSQQLDLPAITHRMSEVLRRGRPMLVLDRNRPRPW